MQTVDVVSVINPEWRLHDGQSDHEFDTSRSAEAEICALLNRQAGRKIGVRELADQAQWNRSASAALIVERQRIELQPVTIGDSVRAAIEKQRGLNRTNDGNPVFNVSEPLQVTTG